MQSPGGPTYGGPAIQLSVPAAGIAFGGLVLRLPTPADVDGIAPSFDDPELCEAGNLPPFTRDDLIERLPGLPALVASGRLAPLVVVDLATGEVLGGGGALHHLDAERATIEIGYWLYPHARAAAASRLSWYESWQNTPLRWAYNGWPRT